MFWHNINQLIIQGNDIFKDYTITEQLGCGNANIYLATNKNDNKKMAVKEIMFKDLESKNQFQNEMKILSQIDHPSIIKFEDYCVVLDLRPEFSNEKIGYLLMEKGRFNLEQLLNKKQESFSLNIFENFCRQCIDGLAYLQVNCISHGDIKPQNLLCMNDEIFKWCDFGTGFFKSKQQRLCKQIRGTISFMAPELIENLQNTNFKYNPFKADSFSLGLVFLYVLSLQQFTSYERQNMSMELQQEIINQMLYQIKISLNNYFFFAIIKNCLQWDPNDRWDFIQLQKYFDKWIQKQQKKELKQKIISNQKNFLEQNKQNVVVKKRRAVTVKSKTSKNVQIVESQIEQNYVSIESPIKFRQVKPFLSEKKSINKTQENQLQELIEEKQQLTNNLDFNFKNMQLIKLFEKKVENYGQIYLNKNKSIKQVDIHDEEYSIMNNINLNQSLFNELQINPECHIQLNTENISNIQLIDNNIDSKQDFSLINEIQQQQQQQQLIIDINNLQQQQSIIDSYQQQSSINDNNQQQQQQQQLISDRNNQQLQQSITDSNQQQQQQQ